MRLKSLYSILLFKLERFFFHLHWVLLKILSERPVETVRKY